MLIKTYGDERKPKLLALHPMLADGASMALLAGKLRENYCVVAPDLSGQGQDSGSFESAEREAETLYAYLKEKNWLEFPLVYGASLGAAVGIKLLEKPDLRIGRVVFDGCPLYANAPVLCWLMTRVYLKKHRKAVKNHQLCYTRMSSLYGPVFGPAMANSFIHMREESLRAIVKACSHCDFPKYPKALEERLHFEYGSRDFDCKTGKKNLAKHYPHATVTVREGYAHCQYISEQGERYGDMLAAYLPGLDGK